MLVKPNRDSNKELDRKIAQLMGFEISEWQYKSLDSVNPTTFTNPPQFSVSDKLVDHMLKFAKEKGIEIISYQPEDVCRAFIEGSK